MCCGWRPACTTSPSPRPTAAVSQQLGEMSVCSVSDFGAARPQPPRCPIAHLRQRPHSPARTQVRLPRGGRGGATPSCPTTRRCGWLTWEVRQGAGLGRAGLTVGWRAPGRAAGRQTGRIISGCVGAWCRALTAHSSALHSLSLALWGCPAAAALPCCSAPRAAAQQVQHRAAALPGGHRPVPLAAGRLGGRRLGGHLGRAAGHAVRRPRLLQLRGQLRCAAAALVEGAWRGPCSRGAASSSLCRAAVPHPRTRLLLLLCRCEPTTQACAGGAAPIRRF